MTRFLLIRHAATELLGKRIAGRMNGVPLAPAGYEQAHRLARRLAGAGIRAVYSSPQERARETARILAGVLSEQVQIASQLDELDYGDWTGQVIDELESVPQWQAFNTARSCTRIPNGELIAEVQARVVGLMEQLRARHSEESIALVTHGDVIRAALAYYLGSPLDLMLRLEISPASVSIIEIKKHGPSILCVNQTESM
jgi:probable phosphomutase (TIGR03848 family)